MNIGQPGISSNKKCCCLRLSWSSFWRFSDAAFAGAIAIYETATRHWRETPKVRREICLGESEFGSAAVAPAPAAKGSTHAACIGVREEREEKESGSVAMESWKRTLGESGVTSAWSILPQLQDPTFTITSRETGMLVFPCSRTC